MDYFTPEQQPLNKPVEKSTDIYEQIITEEQNLFKALKTGDKKVVASAIKEQLSSIDAERKSLREDPFYLYSYAGYNPKKMVPSWGILSMMGNQPNMNAIRTRRKNQITAFSQKQKDQFSAGYVINKIDDSDVTEQEKAEIDYLYKYTENCGIDEVSHVNADGTVTIKKRKGDFVRFMRSMTDNSIVLDHAPYEVVLNRLGEPVYFTTLDPHTIRQADSYHEDTYSGNRELKNGEYPKWVQIINEIEVASFYDDEIDVVIRNFQDSIYNYGYGYSELEDLINVITDLNNAYRHNGKAFSEIMADRIINIKGDEGRGRLNEFRQLVRASLMGTQNSHGNMITAHEKGMEIIKLNENNKDMEYSQWIRILVSLLCALYVISPEEINFESVKSSSNPLGKSENEKLIKYSKDAGLRPILKVIQDSLNNKIFSRFFDGKYQIKFVGLDAETQDGYEDRKKKRLETDTTLNEIRAEENKPPLEHGDIILNAEYIKWVQYKEGGQQQGEGGDGNGQPPNVNNQPQLKQDNKEDPEKQDSKKPDEESKYADTPENRKLNRVGDTYKALNPDNLFQVMMITYLNKLEEDIYV